MTHFNQLTPAQAERLALLAEELGEAQQAIGKILRHGFESRHPTTPGPTNRESLERELGDVCHAIARLADAGDVQAEVIEHRAADKRVTVAPYLHHQ